MTTRDGHNHVLTESDTGIKNQSDRAYYRKRTRFVRCFGSALAVLSATGLFAILTSRTPAQGPATATFHSFNGCNRVAGESAQLTQQLGTGWYRLDFSWNDVEPEKGKWDWATLDNAVRVTERQGAQVLPILDYSALWAASVKGNYLSIPNEPDWDDYVEQVVSRYSVPPYNLRYFQVWNEPTIQAGFLKGTTNNLDYIDKIFLPAAKIIRKHNCYVVFGGWPSSNSLDQLKQELEHSNAWQWTDIVDVHYFPMNAWPTLYQDWIASHRCKGLWQSEIGWNTFPNFLPNTYWRVLYWSMQQGWQSPDAYKLFWYDRLRTGADAEKALITKNPNGAFALTAHGQRLAVMNELLGDAALETFTNFTTNPSYPPTWVEVNPTVLGIRVGTNRIVIALLLPASIASRPVSVSVALPSKPAHVDLLSATGDSLPVTSGYVGGHLQVTASTARFSTAVAASRPTGAITYSIGYLKIDL